VRVASAPLWASRQQRPATALRGGYANIKNRHVSTPADSPILIFEDTYTQQFADKPIPTPRYDYNQILYRLDLDDPALKPAQTP